MSYSNSTIIDSVHIIALENEPSSFRGGQELSLLEVCRGLSQRGHKISLIYVKEGNLLKEYQEFCVETVKVNNYIFNRRKIKDIFVFLADISKIYASRNSVVYSNHYYDVIFGYALALSKHIPFICHLRLPPLDKFGRLHMMGLKGVKQFITISNQTKLDWINLGLNDRKIDVIYNSINYELFKPTEKYSNLKKEWKIPENIRVISYVGRLDREKGLETLIKAFALVLNSGAKARLLIAGKPLSTEQEYQNSLEQLAINLEIEEYVSFLGHVNDTSSLYQVSDVTVLPSLWPEPFGRTIIESMACGTPVVASRTGGIPEILTGEFQKVLFETGNERDLSDKLSKIMHWREKEPQFGERCRTHVLCNFDQKKMIDSIEEVFRKVVNQ